MFNAPIIGTVTWLSITIFYGMNAMAGIGLGLCMVSTFSRCQKAALNYGYFNNIETQEAMENFVFPMKLKQN